LVIRSFPPAACTNFSPATLIVLPKKQKGPVKEENMAGRGGT
jgi:hypothetical protein